MSKELMFSTSEDSRLDKNKVVVGMSGGVDWLDTQRHLLEEFNEVDRHTIPLTGDLIEYK